MNTQTFNVKQDKISTMLAIEPFKMIVWYNGYHDLMKYWLELLQKAKAESEPLIIICDRLDGQYSPDDMAQIEVLNIILVTWFGDWGVSPRVGWIEEIDNCIDFLKEIIRDTEAIA